jgi:hypothetical protein
MADVPERLVGGCFGLETPGAAGGTPPPFLDERAILLVNARSAIRLAVEAVRPDRVWMPSYLCGVMISAIPEWSDRIRFYAVEYDLQIKTREWIDGLTGGDMVVLIAYFGFPVDPALKAAIKARGAWIVEDASQALLSEGVGDGSDCVVYSPRKFLGVPDGGILVWWRSPPHPKPPLEDPPDSWWLGSLSSALLRRDFDLRGGDRSWFALFQEADRNAPVGPYRMSTLSRALVAAGIDYPAVAIRRRENYAILLERLPELALIPDLPEGVAPLGFPIGVRERDVVRRRLYERQIYPPVHWNINGVVSAEFRESHRLSRDIMTIPCDQRLSREDMERVADAIARSGAAGTRWKSVGHPG